MKSASDKLEAITNIAIIVVAILLGIFLVQKMFFVKHKSSDPAVIQTTPIVGEQIQLSDVIWANQPKTILLVLQKGCRFCTESSPFYRELIKKAQMKNIRVIAVLPQNKEDSEKYLIELGLPKIDVKQASLKSLKVRGTPTIFFINDKGEVLKFWVGRLTPNKESEVVNEL